MVYSNISRQVMVLLCNALRRLLFASPCWRQPESIPDDDDGWEALHVGHVGGQAFTLAHESLISTKPQSKIWQPSFSQGCWQRSEKYHPVTSSTEPDVCRIKVQVIGSGSVYKTMTQSEKGKLFFWGPFHQKQCSFSHWKCSCLKMAAKFELVEKAELNFLKSTPCPDGEKCNFSERLLLQMCPGATVNIYSCMHFCKNG